MPQVVIAGALIRHPFRCNTYFSAPGDSFRRAHPALRWPCHLVMGTWLGYHHEGD